LYFRDAAAGERVHFRAGEVVDVRWRAGERAEIERVAAAVLPVHGGYAVAASEPVAGGAAGTVAATAPAAATMAAGDVAIDGGTRAVSAPVTTGERVNAAIDDLVAVGNRLLELPLVVVLGALGAGALGLAVAGGWLSKRAGRAGLGRAVTAGAWVLAGLGAVWIVDRKIAGLEGQVAALRAKSSADTSALLEKVAQAKPSKREALFVDVAAANKMLTPVLGEVSIRPLVYNEAIDVYQVHTNNPLAQAWLAVVDLTHPNVQVKVQADFNWKTLTSAFAKENDCVVAINGEAGQTPAQGSGLGLWRGWMVKDGKQLMAELPGNPRPYLAFDAKNRASFTAMAAKDRSAPTGAPTVIWGRLDAVVNGVVQTENERNRQPRTAMGTNGDGTKLYLMVVDGRQPRYSLGFSRAEVGTFLKAFGATDGMLCDEGGSTCMYLDQFGGIANVPSDNNGQERPTYTHFGVGFSGK
jgi:exopolysaccharide biosynthesis protein